MQNRYKLEVYTLLLFISVMLSGFHLSAHNKDTVFVSSRYSVHMAFESEIRYVDVSDNTPIVPRIIDGYSNLLSLKCSEEFDRLSNLTVMLSSGVIETFILKYRNDDIDLLIDRRESRSRAHTGIRDILSMDKQYFHIGTRKEGILVLCDVI